MTSVRTAFSIPEDGNTYISEINDRCHDLINFGVWGDLHISRLRGWLTNFTTEEEKYFAACVLDSLIYRSKEQTDAIAKHLFQRTLPDLTRADPTPLGQLREILKSLQAPTTDPGIRLVVAVNETDPPTKSANAVARLLRRHLSINQTWIIKPWEMYSRVGDGIRIFIFIDDFLGTGDQFVDLLQKQNLTHKFLDENYVAYMPFVACSKGLDQLRSVSPRVRLASVEELDESYGLFHPASKTFEDGVNTPETAKEYYYNLLKVKGLDISGPERRGYGHLELTYAFEHATPDNSLPILWWSESQNWKPLFDR